MEINFKIKKGKLIYGGGINVYSGSVNMNVCRFEITNNADFSWICVFKFGEETYQQMIMDGKCVIPQEVLKREGLLKIGCYATDENRRISTNWVELKIEDGAYCEATKPAIPTPDVWESLIANSMPYIGEDGNWYIYDLKAQQYVNSRKPSFGEKGDKGDKGDSGNDGKDGYTPQRGIDYWTEMDKQAIQKDLEEKLNFEERLAKVVGKSGNSLIGKKSGEFGIVINDVSPIEHIMNVKIKQKNLLPYPYTNSTSTLYGVSFIDNGDRSITVSGTPSGGSYFYFATFPASEIDNYKLQSASHRKNISLVAVFTTQDQQIITEKSTTNEFLNVGRNDLPQETAYVKFGIKRNQNGLECSGTIYPILTAENIKNAIVAKCDENLLPYPYDSVSNTTNGVTFVDNKDGSIRVSGIPNDGSYFFFSKIPVSGEFSYNLQSMLPKNNISLVAVFTSADQRAIGEKSSIENTLKINNDDLPQGTEYIKFGIKRGQNGVECSGVIYPVLTSGETAFYTSDEDGVIEGVISHHPGAVLFIDKKNIEVSCEYNRDINKAYEELTNAIISLGGNV